MLPRAMGLSYLCTDKADVSTSPQSDFSLYPDTELSRKLGFDVCYVCTMCSWQSAAGGFLNNPIIRQLWRTR